MRCVLNNIFPAIQTLFASLAGPHAVAIQVTALHSDLLPVRIECQSRESNVRLICQDIVRTLPYRQCQNMGVVMSASNLSKTERIDVRASSAVKQLLQEAARSCHQNVSEFLLNAGVIAANQALADRRRFVLDDEQWQAFQQVLDRPVQAKPRLKKLLSEPGVLG